METARTLAEALPQEIERVKELVKLYRSIGPAGEIAARLMELDIKSAESATTNQDTVAMLRAFYKLQGWEA